MNNNYAEAARRVKVDKLIAYIDGSLGYVRTDEALCAAAEAAVATWTDADWAAAERAAGINKASATTRMLVDFTLTCRTRLAAAEFDPFKGLA